MNKRIDELKQLATTVVRGHGPFGEHERDYRLNPEKFAELIINECYEWAKENGGISDSVDYAALKKHFGVET